MSSLFSPATNLYDAEHGNDGDPSNMFHTNYAEGEWWRVNLEAVSCVESIKIYNRVNSCKLSLKAF